MKIKALINKSKEQIYTLYIAYKKKETPLIAKIFSIIIVAYALSPIDLIPDFIPILGYIDDLIIIPLGVMIAIKLIPQNILKECELEAKEKLKEDIKESKVAGVVIGIIWIIIIAIILFKIYKKIHHIK